MDPLELLQRRFERERQARKQAEALLEDKSRKLYEAVQVLEQSKTALERQVEERVQTEEKHRANQQRLNAVMNSVVDAVITLDGDGLIHSYNRGAERTFGHSVTQVLGQNVSMLVPAAEAEGRSPLLPEEEPTGQSREITARHKDGHDFPLELTVSRMEMPDEEDLMVAVCRDISHRKKREEERLALERELSQAQKMESLGTLSGGIAHEINTPVQYVGDNIRFLNDAFGDLALVLEAYDKLQEVAKGHEPAAEALAKVAEAAEEADLEYLRDEIPSSIEQTLEGVTRVAKIVQAIKEFSHPGAVEKSAIDINQAIETTITVTRNQWKYVADLEQDFAADLPLVPCLPGDFNQVILNLIVNAAHAIEAKHQAAGIEAQGQIQVSTRTLGKAVEIRVQDSGTGMTPEVRKKIFDPFFTTKEPGKGTGQGLSICHTIIAKKHGGELDLETEPGAGTTFIIRLPLEAAGSDQEEAA